jgi:NAD(P)-dependent dehydrogenase (short-subunit alcohol dehydrogenase family)
VYFIVGAAGGVGRALTARLVAKGAEVVAVGRNEDRLASLAQETGACPLVLDARSVEGIAQGMATTVQRFGRLDGAVNLAGSILLKSAGQTSEAEWDEVLATNLKTAFAVVRGAAPVLAQAGGGSIVLMSSVAARVGLMNHEAIAAAKAGVVGLTLAAAATYAPKNVRINAIAPGLVDTPLAGRILSHEASRRASEAMHPLGRVGNPVQIASAISWLLDAEQDWVTGQVMGIDGGLGSLRGRP